MCRPTPRTRLDLAEQLDHVAGASGRFCVTRSQKTTWFGNRRISVDSSPRRSSSLRYPSTPSSTTATRAGVAWGASTDSSDSSPKRMGTRSSSSGLRCGEPRLLVGKEVGLVDLEPAAALEPERAGVEAGADQDYSELRVCGQLGGRRSSMIRWRTGNDRGFFRLARRFATARASSVTKRWSLPAFAARVLGATGQRPEGRGGDRVGGRRRRHPASIRPRLRPGSTGRRPPISRSGRAGRAGRARRPATPRRGSSTRRCHDSRPPGRACACGGSPRSALPGPPSPRASARSAHPS